VTVAPVALVASAVTAGAQNGIKVSHYPPVDTASPPWSSAKAVKVGLTCLASPLTCPDPFYSSPASGGQGGSGGYLRIGFTQVIPAAADVFTGWVSPPFKYDGAEGQKPNELSLSLFRTLRGRVLVDPDLGNQVLYSVGLVDSNGDVAAEPIENRSAHEANAWTRVEASIDPDDLKVGETYQIVIVTEFKTGAQVVPSANNFVGYDTVDLKAKFNPALSGGGGGGGGGRQTIFKHWYRLIVKDKCPKSLHAHSCLSTS
jgi:hypothetical protein